MFLQGLQFLLKGGPVMWPLLVCAIIAVTVMIERAIALSRAVSGNNDLIERVQTMLKSGRDEDALRIAVNHTGPAAKLIALAIQNRHRDYKSIERLLEELSLQEIPLVSQRLGVLDTIVTIAPLLGLLGTVTGMISAFSVLGDPSTINGPAAITGGVAQALIATATGLAIAIVTLVGYNALGERVKAVVSSMELGATKVINIYADRQSAHGEGVSVTGRSGEANYEAATARA